jgi:hypothetical protein
MNKCSIWQQPDKLSNEKSLPVAVGEHYAESPVFEVMA